MDNNVFQRQSRKLSKEINRYLKNIVPNSKTLGSSEKYPKNYRFLMASLTGIVKGWDFCPSRWLCFHLLWRCSPFWCDYFTIYQLVILIFQILLFILSLFIFQLLKTFSSLKAVLCFSFFVFFDKERPGVFFWNPYCLVFQILLPWLLYFVQLLTNSGLNFLTQSTQDNPHWFQSYIT